MVGIRPESVLVGSGEGLRVAGRLRVVESLGRETLLYIDAAPLVPMQMEAQEQPYVVVHQASQESHPHDAAVTIAIDGRHVFLFDALGRTIRFPEHNVRGDNVQVIQDLTPLNDIAVSVEVDRKVCGVRLAPSGDPLAHSIHKG